MIINSFRPILPNTALIASADAFFSVIKHDYLDYRNRGIFIEYPDQCILVYRLIENDYSYLGLIAGLPAEQYDAGRIKKHEGTLAASEQQQLQLLLLREAVVKPVLLTYPAVDNIDQKLEEIANSTKPALSINDGGISHELFAVNKESSHYSFIRKAFKDQVESLYIADGHHRSSVLGLYNKQKIENKEQAVPLLSAIFSSKQVRVQAFHRLVQLPVGTSPLVLLAKLSKLCSIEALPKAETPTEVHQFNLLIGDECFALRWLPEVIAKIQEKDPDKKLLDAGLFNTLIADPIFEIKDVKTDTRISYISGNKGLRGMLDKIQRRPNQVGFLLHGIEAEDLFHIVDQGLIMPPKSTWFEPRLRNGLVVLEV